MTISKAIVCIILLIPTCVLGGSLTHTFSFPLDDVHFSSYHHYDVVKIKEGIIDSDVGSPSIPFIVANFVIPPSAEVTRVYVISKKEVEIPGVFDICPIQTPRPFSTTEDIPFSDPDPYIYHSSSPYPGEDIVMFPSGSMGGYRIAGISVNPLQYIPNEKRLILTTEMVIGIDYEEGIHEKIELTGKQREEFGRGVKAIVENIHDIARFAPPVKGEPARACNFAVVTGAGYANDWQTLVDWKIDAGYSAQVFTTDWIYANYAGYDNPEQIRNFLKDYYLTEGLIYAVLGGDVALVPERDVYNNQYSPNWLASDYYYSDLDGDWDGDGDHTYGELSDGVDGYFDIYVGRPPSDDSLDTKAFLWKDSVYIFAPPAPYIQKLLLPSELLWSDPYYHGHVVNNEIGDMFPTWTVTKLEDGNAVPPYTREEFNNNYNLMHISAHGYTDGTSLFNSNDIPFLTNVMPTVMNAISCYSGNFDEAGDCFAERLVNKDGGSGCVAVIMNSRYGWGTPPNMGPSEKLDTTLYSVILKDTLPIGIVHAATKNHYRNIIWSDGLWHYCGTELNLFGDPQMPIRLTATTEPYIDVTAHVLNDNNGNGTWEPGEDAELVVTLTNGGGVPANNVQGVLQVVGNGQYVDVFDSTSSFGTISVCGSVDNSSDPYTLSSDSGTPSGTQIDFNIHVTAQGGYSWDLPLYLVVATPCFDHDISNVRFTLTNSGICGFIDESHSQGSGFSYPLSGNQHLYIGSVWAGNNPGYMVNKDYSAENSGDWVSVDGVFGNGTVYSDQDSWAKFSDGGMGSPKGLTCSQDGWAWSDPGGEDYVIVRYTFKNEGASTINSLYFGQFMDWNVGNPDDNTGGVDLSRNLIYMYGTGTKYVGVGVLDPEVIKAVSFVHNPTYVDPNGYILDSDKDWFLKGILGTQTPSPSDDWSTIVSIGQYTLYPGESVVFAVAVLGGEDESDIQSNYDNAKSHYGLVGAEEKEVPHRGPTRFTISKIYPQPFSSKVFIEYTVPHDSWVTIEVYDVVGRKISTLIHSRHSSGRYTGMWNGTGKDGSHAGSGVYFCRLTVDGKFETAQKLLLVQ
jgi:hypothetical protein